MGDLATRVDHLEMILQTLGYLVQIVLLLGIGYIFGALKRGLWP